MFNLLLPVLMALPRGLNADQSQLWPNGLVPYTFEKMVFMNGEEEEWFSGQDKQLIRKAMSHISEQVPCISFRYIQLNIIFHLIYLVHREVERNGKAGQTVNLGSDECYNIGTVLHNIMHSLGISTLTWLLLDYFFFNLRSKT